MNNLAVRLTWLSAYPFRLFFVLGALWAIISMLAWTLILLGYASAPTLSMIPMHWHAHEMIHGFPSAVIAGFLLTAMANWTGIPAISGRALVALGLLWVSGRLVMILSGLVPDAVVWSLPALFYGALAVIVVRDLWQARNRRNAVMALVLVVLGLASALMVSGALSMNWPRVTAGTHLSLYTLTLLMAVIAGRITPAFSANWLRMRERAFDDVKRLPWLEWSSLLALVFLAAADIAGAADGFVALLGLVAGALHLVRLWFWRGWRVASEPLLWVLHLGYLSLALSLVARGAIAGTDYSLSLWYHLLGLGAMGILIIGVMTRVAMGHTGRPLHLPLVGLVAYLALLAALFARLLSFAWPEWGYQGQLATTAAFWTLGFAAFLWGYTPILTAPRPDGRAG